MVDTLVRGHGLHISPAFVSTKGVFNGQRSFVKPSKIEGAKVHGPNAVVDFFEADVLFGEDVADVDPLRMPANAAVPIDAPDFEMGRVRDRREAIGNRTWGWR